MARMEEFFKRYARGRGVMMAERLHAALGDILSLQAPTRMTRGGRIVAATPAFPNAPPRRVTGKLKDSRRVIRTAHGARVAVFAPYAMPLERRRDLRGFPHKFMSVALERLGISGRALLGG